MNKRTCTVDGCNRAFLARGYCQPHYGKLYRAGLIHKRSADDRFDEKTITAGDCLIWTGALNKDGYGLFRDGTTGLAHRFAWARVNGPIPTGLEIDHRCWNRACVNPAHLRLATNKQNGENQKGPTRSNQSGIRGVYWHKANKKWVVQAGHNGRKHYAGQFLTLEDAEQAAIALRNSLFTHNDADKAA